uniref:Lipase/esterase n=1 Tax=uncultured sludge bacterium TaxID=641485 RepID=E0WCJ5_9BACT|nr:lipase/esterase [uncultured sludge bacterium]
MKHILSLPTAMLGHTLRAAMNLPAPLLSRLAGAPIVVAGRQLDIQAQLIVRLLRTMQRPYDGRSVAHIRREFEFFVAVSEPDQPQASRLREISIAGRHGPIPVTLVAPTQKGIGSHPCILYYHGGGFVIGSRRTAMAHCARLADATGAVVANVDYRLAPEHKFPVAVEDAYDALYGLQQRAVELGIDGTRLAVSGDSAGATLSAVVSHMARDAGLQGLRAQWLIYPLTLVGARTASRKHFASGFLLEQSTIDWFAAQYLPPDSARDPRASPLLSPSFVGLPLAIVSTAGFDPLCDEGEAYAHNLQAAGVPVIRYSYPSIHGFINMPAMHYARAALDEGAAALRSALEM